MCFDHDSAPPVPKGPHEIDADHTLLTSADGTKVAAFAARPRTLPEDASGIVILPDVRGLYGFYEQVAIGLAEAGNIAVVYDYYGRTATPEPRAADFPFMEHIMKTTRKGVLDDLGAATEHARALAGTQTLPLFSLGFCFGGRFAFDSSRPEFGLAGAIGYYGVPGIAGPLGPGPTQHAAELSAPILGIFGGADENIPVSEVNAFEEALSSAGVPHDIHMYDGAPHSFFDIKYQEHREASADAWKRTMEFIEHHRQGPENG